MSCTPIDIFVFAHWLDDTKPEQPSPSLIRTIINRAYYAALISARDFTGSSTSGKGGHRNVVDALRLKSPDAANKLNSMRLQRGKVDYDLSVNVSIRDAKLSLVNSRAILYASGQAPPVSKLYDVNFLDKSKFIEIDL